MDDCHQVDRDKPENGDIAIVRIQAIGHSTSPRPWCCASRRGPSARRGWAPPCAHRRAPQPAHANDCLQRQLALIEPGRASALGPAAHAIEPRSCAGCWRWPTAGMSFWICTGAPHHATSLHRRAKSISHRFARRPSTRCRASRTPIALASPFSLRGMDSWFARTISSLLVEVVRVRFGRRRAS